MRFYKIKEIGTNRRGDDISYTNIAKSWSEGNFIFRNSSSEATMFRPAVYIFYATGIKLFGYHDYSIKMINAFFGSLNILLIFFICLIMTEKNLWLSLSSALIYALLPVAIYYSRVEMTHTISSTMTLLCFLFFVLYFQSERVREKYLFLIFSGIFVALAALAHEDLILVAFGFLAFLFANIIFQANKKLAIRTFIKDAGIFSIFPLITSHFIIALGSDFIGMLQKVKNANQNTAGITGYMDWFFRYMWHAISANCSKATLYLFLLVSVFVFVKMVQNLFKIKRFHFSIPPLFFLPLAVVIVYIALYAYFIRFFAMRLFLPLVPLVFMAILMWLWKVLDIFSLKFANGILVFIALFIIPLHVEQFKDFTESQGPGYPYKRGFTFYPDFNISRGLKRFASLNYRKTWARLRYEELKDKVNENARVLITSSYILSERGRRIFQLEYYFGDNAIYIIDHDEPLDDLIAQYKIKYVLFSTCLKVTRRAPKEEAYERYRYNGQWAKPQPIVFGSSYGFKKGDYSIAKEFTYLIKYLDSKKAKILYRTGFYQGKISTIVERLKRETPSPHYIVFEL